jgi:hypothetical protein
MVKAAWCSMACCTEVQKKKKQQWSGESLAWARVEGCTSPETLYAYTKFRYAQYSTAGPATVSTTEKLIVYYTLSSQF